MRRSIGLLITLVLVVASPGAGQETSPLRVQVRLTPQPRMLEGHVPPQALRGTLLRISGDSLWLQVHPNATPIGIGAAGVSRLEVSRGTPSRPLTALVNGASVGVLLGAHSAFMEATGRSNRYGSTGEAALVGAAFGVGAGIVLGAIFPQEFWRRVQWGDLQGSAQ